MNSNGLESLLQETEVPGSAAFEAVTATIARQAEMYPERVAVECAGTALTYGALVGRAGAIAERLAAAGAGPGERVAVSMARSADLVAALLGVLWSGAAYLPLDPMMPEDRVRSVLEDSRALLVLTDDLTVGAKDGMGGGMGGVPTLPVSGVNRTPVGAVPCRAMAEDDLAYVIYTSGSTGKPKGVAIGHGALRSLLCAAQVLPGFDADDVLVAITTCTFDISVMDFWLPLFSGARLVVADGEESRNPAKVRRLLDRHGATMLEATPGFWLALIDEGWTTRTRGAARVRVLCGGEAMSRDLADMLLERADEVWNMYGPTECCVWVSATRVTAGTEPPTVGGVMPGSTMLVVDEALRPVPAGAEGELVIAGTNVGVGYWERPEMSAKAFVRNPFGPGRMYRTGDLAIERAEGGLKLLGRADFQVKVRGFRIELGEIEHALRRHPAVREAVVLQHALEGAQPSVSLPLVGYVDVGGAAQAGLVAELEETLRRALPEYMVPARIVPVAGLPRLFNGKIDRRALPAMVPPAETAAEVQYGVGQYVAPRDVVERQLAHIWESTLGLSRIGVETSFFALGVDSLAALRLITRVNRTFGTSFGLANLLTADCVAAIAGLIRNQHAPSVDRALVPLRTEGGRVPLFMIHGVGGNILTFTGLAARLPDDQPVYALQAQALLTRQAALLRIEDMATYYIREVRTVQARGPYRLLGYSFGGTVAAEMARQLRAAGEEVSLLAMLDARTRAFELEHAAWAAQKGTLESALGRLAIHTKTMGWRERLEYMAGRLRARVVRGLTYMLHRVGARTLPSALKMAWDVNLIAFRMYRPEKGKGRVVLVRAREQRFAEGPRDLGWSRYFPDGVSLYEIEGDHERMFVEPALTKLVGVMEMVLEEAC